MKPIEKRTFVHRFSGGIVCRMTVTAAGPVCEWSKRPKMTRRFRAEYRAWQHQVMQTVADETGKRILQMVETRPGKWEALTVEPRKPNSEDAG